MGTFPAMMPFTAMPYIPSVSTSQKGGVGMPLPSPSATAGGATLLNSKAPSKGVGVGTPVAPPAPSINKKDASSARITKASSDDEATEDLETGDGNKDDIRDTARGGKRTKFAGSVVRQKRSRRISESQQIAGNMSPGIASLALLADAAENPGDLDEMMVTDSLPQSGSEKSFERYESKGHAEDVSLEELGIDSAALASMDEKELKKLKRKHSNRESARRSRMRKQAEIEQLQAENSALRAEVDRLNLQMFQLQQQLSKYRCTPAASQHVDLKKK